MDLLAEYPRDVVKKRLGIQNLALIGDLGEPGRLIAEQCLEIMDLLLAKNAAYGNSALEPVNIFARTSTAVQQIDVRIDDKLSRIARGHTYADEDTVQDLLGYLVLRRIAVALQQGQERGCLNA